MNEDTHSRSLLRWDSWWCIDLWTGTRSPLRITGISCFFFYLTPNFFLLNKGKKTREVFLLMNATTRFYEKFKAHDPRPTAPGPTSHEVLPSRHEKGAKEMTGIVQGRLSTFQILNPFSPRKNLFNSSHF